MGPGPILILNALNAILIQGSPYEARRKTRALASRYTKSNQFDTVIDVFASFSRPGKLGVDLGSLLLDAYESKGREVSDGSRGRLTQSIALTVDQLDESGPWRKTLIDEFIAWSAKHG
ncbi:hypothetical protein PM082_015611 [Marasmius tenuissimus]|nr:hypothetical protein PM082_015611 [Marasmius tenuissimus]